MSDGRRRGGIEDAEARPTKADKLIYMLKPADWRRSERCAGIAGKMTPRGQLPVGGAKGVARAIHGALANPNQDAYR